MRIHLRPGLVSCLFLLASAAGSADEATATRRVQAHTAFLADDLLEGRGTGSRGFALAARYVASQFARIGIEPGADGGFEQPVKFLEAANKLEAGRFIIRHDGQEDSLAPLNDMLTFAAHGETAAELTAPAVFVGFGVQAPESDYNDYSGIDVKGKIVVCLSGAPTRFPSEQRAHHSNLDQKRAVAVNHGAVGFVMIRTPRDESHRPWPVVAAQLRFPAMRLLDEKGAVVDGFPELRAVATLPSASAGRVLVASGHTAEEVLAKAERGEPQSFPLNVSLTLAGAADVRPVDAANVLGWLPGLDPALARKPIVITAHLDHLGIGAPVNGDSIYNGAMDNAIGVALILAIAEDLATGPRLARPVLFAALCGEEKGLLGANHLALHPPARVQRFAANLNIDMTLFPAPVRDIIPWGASHTTLGAAVDAAAARRGFTVSPDPIPDETIFVRSDQYPFVRAGVPAVYVGTGQNSKDPAVDIPAAWDRFLRERYHKPADDMNQPVDWPSTGAYAALVEDLTRDLAGNATDPAWLPGDFFGELFGRDR